MIHGGLYLHLEDQTPWVEACCLRPHDYAIEIGRPFWPIREMSRIRENNLAGQWDPGCDACRNLESAGILSMRQGMNRGLGIFGREQVSGPARIDIMFDISCNLACRTCGPEVSTFWQHHLRSLGEWDKPIQPARSRQQVIQTLRTLDLSNLRQVIFCGGETLLGQEYWEVARWIVQNTPNAKQNLTLCFQTNGTQSISPRNFDVIDSCKLVKLQVSIDGIGTRFEYLRWPASWSQVCDNLMDLRERLPGNVMFLIEQTISIFNVLDLQDVDDWVEEKFNADATQDRADCTRHLAWGKYAVKNSSRELMQKMREQRLDNLVAADWAEDPAAIRLMLEEIQKFDQHRGQAFAATFPAVFDCFRRFC
jgi:sulfatase maturation enzyme AslB (radical SAM superfamily)